ncbi:MULTISPECIES: acyl-CoA dehydrogenase family protein [Psychrobacter]|uniref:Acyl-CoA dehydrogenase family protein n=1 Tax=Psychrobacter proteolyticus TaxID=147825 RepID=A0ABV0D2I8_9GAMM|nr:MULTISPECIES: acyl-CoA dehydrogenase family protein [Psychrobacter]MBA6245226.1 acyl-CoA dehydrogenase family protein [Psychrobacter sp. Urea-trap-18]MBA6285627.1 acyl-CoA dehydrogenase family protein [Psychrobacter sp. Urea-trap-16]MBA6318874.1 acyl-CoA dehydrogenase family protein [Psychrobacter sp. Urea-trap-20]MBA6333985.1 acyl-CoA dehydrogenase family protein [Psychrobacter sp. Urea-trap-19]MDN3441791.1 acyl-CoA dehydrogenase family protein [Psychrobacter sp. APC 3279]|tara:strand:- start:60723 stop:61877 length:1155 start_codon:yes stop_codon:yes gene_type:complete
MIRDKETLDHITQTIRNFVNDQLIPMEHWVAENDRLPEEIIEQMRELGLFGLTIPEEYGGLGVTMEEEVTLAFELGRTSPAFRSLIGTNNGIGSSGLVIDGTEAQKQKYLPRLASGEIIGSFCLTEPESGSDAASLKTTAIKDGDTYIINGTKRYITNAPQAGVFTVMARTDPQNKRSGGISAFIVESDTPGITLGKIDKKMGQKGAHTCDVIFDNCVVPADALIGGVEGVGFKTAMKVLDKGRLHIAAASTGAATRMLNDALNYAVERKQFGQPIASFQLIQGMLADSKAEIYAAKSMVLDAARLRDEGKDVVTESSCAKMFATEMCGRVADRAVQIHGGAGYIADYGIERFYRDVRLYRLYEGTTQIQQVIIARNMIKEASE